MELGTGDCLLVTGATGLVGSHVAERANRLGISTRVARVIPRVDDRGSLLKVLAKQVGSARGGSPLHHLGELSQFLHQRELGRMGEPCQISSRERRDRGFPACLREDAAR